MGWDILFGHPAATGTDRVWGVVIGLVTNTKDPDGLGRVRVTFPWLSEQDESSWARVVSPMAGHGRGLLLLPEVGDEVLVAFDQGLIERPCILGGLWNGQDKPPVANADGKNNIRMLKSRSGHVIRLDDTEGHEKVEIVDKTGRNSIVLDTEQNTLTLSAQGDITIRSANGKVAIHAETVELNGTTSARVQAGKLSLQAQGELQIRGATVDIN